MCESLVGFCHLMGIFTLLECATGLIGCIHDLVGKSLLHGSLRTLTSVKSDPTKTESLTTVLTDLDRDLVGSTTDTAGFNLEDRHYIFHSLLEYVERLLTCLIFDDLKGTVNDFLSDTFFTIEHNTVYKTCYKL